MQGHVNSEINSPSLAGVQTPEAKLTAFLETELGKIGYDLVAIEILNHREKKLCVYIDHLGKKEGIGIEDCVQANDALDLPLEANDDVIAIFKGPYELEVSSPGLDRPLRRAVDFNRYTGEIARITTFRPVTGEESKTPDYSEKNPKQKNFFGIVRGFEDETASVLFGIIPDDGTLGSTKKKPSKSKTEKPKPETLIRIPLELVAKAHLDPEVNLPE